MHAPYDRSHWRGIQRKGTEALGGAAGRALDLRARCIKNEYFVKKARGGISIQNEACVSVSHGSYAPEGPKRSVFIARGSCPSSTRIFDAFSTKGVGPQTNVLGRSSGAKCDSATRALSILRP